MIRIAEAEMGNKKKKMLFMGKYLVRNVVFELFGITKDQRNIFIDSFQSPPQIASITTSFLLLQSLILCEYNFEPFDCFSSGSIILLRLSFMAF